MFIKSRTLTRRRQHISTEEGTRNWNHSLLILFSINLRLFLERSRWWQRFHFIFSTIARFRLDGSLKLHSYSSSRSASRVLQGYQKNLSHVFAWICFEENRVRDERKKEIYRENVTVSRQFMGQGAVSWWGMLVLIYRLCIAKCLL